MKLTPSDRISLISEIGHRLGKEEWSLIDLTLRQFSLPWTDDWHGNERSAYVMEMIEKAENATLLSLGQHLGYEFGSSRPQIEPTFWRTGYFRLFVSHLALYRGFAGDLQRDLIEFGVSAFVAHNDIEPTREWQDEIETALATCDGMLVLLHPDFHQSYWTDQEIGYAMGRKLLIVAIRFGHDPYGFIGRFQAMEGEGKSTEDLSRELFDILRRHRQTRKRIAEALVTRFEESSSFDQAKANMDLLEELKYWDSALSSQVRLAVRSNGQIGDAWGVPERVEQLINRMEADA